MTKNRILRSPLRSREITLLGPAKPRRLDKPIAVSLEDLVLRDNFYRHLEAQLDLGFVRAWTRNLYAAHGRPSIDPVRKVWVEPRFAAAKDWHGVRRLRLRGLLNANIQALLLAAGQTLKRRLAATGWGRRILPVGTWRPSQGSHGDGRMSPVDNQPEREDGRSDQSG